MPLGDPVLDYDGLRQYDSKLKQWIGSADSNLVHRTGNETITGTKTFSSPISGTITGVTSAAIKGGGGLALENSKLIVDFSQMPPEQIEDILASMNLPIYIDGVNISTEFYVNSATGIDKLEDDYGKSAAKPWATIAYAATQVANHYNINTKTVHVNVAAGTYTGQLVMGAFTATTGRIVIRPASAEDAVVIQRSIAKDEIGVLCSAGTWTIEDIAFEIIAGAQPADSRNHAVHGVQGNGNSVKLSIVRCPMSFTDNTLASGGGYGTPGIYMLSCFNGANVELGGGSSDSPVTLSGTRSNANVYWLRVSGGAVLAPQTSGGPLHFAVSGSYTQFLSVSGGTYLPTGASNIPVWNAVDSPTGRRYQITDGGRVVTRLASASDVATYFPGSTSGTVQAASYSFISPSE